MLEPREIKIDKKLSEPYRFYFLSDWHLGNVGCATNRINALVKHISEDKNCSVLLLGDLLDSIILKDKRYSVDASKPQKSAFVTESIKELGKVLEPIASKIQCVIQGNHEDKFTEITGIDPLEHTCDYLGLKNYIRDYSGYLRFIMKRSDGENRAIDILVHHGAGGGFMSGAKINRVERRASWVVSADICASGHTHTRSITENTYIMVPQKSLQVVERVQLVLQTGSMLKSLVSNIPTYSSKADYKPNALGNVFASVQEVRRSNSGVRVRELAIEGGFIG